MSPGVEVFRDMMVQFIEWEPRTGLDQYGDAVYGSAVTVRCRVVEKQRMTRNVSGQEMVSTTTIYVLGTPGIDMEDRITLPDGTQPPILNVRMFPDENGPHHEEVYL